MKQKNNPKIRMFQLFYLDLFKNQHKKGLNRKMLEVKQRGEGYYHQCIQVILFQQQKPWWAHKKVVTSPTNPPIDRDFFVSMFKDFAADLDKKIAAIDKKLRNPRKLKKKMKK